MDNFLDSNSQGPKYVYGRNFQVGHPSCVSIVILYKYKI